MANFVIRVVVDPSRVSPGTKKVERALGRVENKANSLRRSLGLTFGALAGGAIIFSAVRSMAKFEEAIATAGAVAKATGAEFDQLTEKALQLGITTRFSATQAAESLVGLSRAGFSVEESLGTVGAVLSLAVAGGLGLAEATDIAASTLRAFRLEVDQSARVTDVLTEAANSANTTVQQLGEGIKFVAPIAAGLGISLEETAAAMGKLSDAGLKSTLAGTGLRRVLAELESPGTELKNILEGAGLAVDQIQPSVVGLTQALETLRTTGITTGEGLEVFGQRGGPAFEVLVNQIPALKELNEKLNNSGGVAAEVAKKLDDTLNGALFRTRSAIDGLTQALGQVGASSAIIAILDTIAEGFRFTARNADILVAALSALAVIIAAKLVPALLGGLVPALNISLVSALRKSVIGLVIYRGNIVALVADTVRARIATLSLGASLSAVKAAVIAGPFIALGIAVAGATLELNRQKRILEDVAKAQESVRESAAFNALGTQIRQASQEMRNLARAQKDAGKITKTQRDEIVKLNRLALTGTADASQKARAELDKLLAATGVFSGTQRQRAQDQITAIRGVRLETKKQAEEGKAVADAQASQAVTTDNLIAGLDRQILALKNLNAESEIRKQAELEIEKLLQAGQGDATSRRGEIEGRLRSLQAAQDMVKVLEEIKGPQEEFKRESAATAALLAVGAINAEEFATKMRDLKDAFDSIEAPQNALDDLTQENLALGVRLRLGEEQAELFQFLNTLQEQEINLTEGVVEIAERELALRRKLTAAITAQADAKTKAQREEETEQRAIQAIADRINIQDRLLEQEGRIEAARNQGIITNKQAAQAQENLALRALEASTALEAGFQRAFIKIKQEAEDLAAVGEKVVNVFADNATNALIKFAETGEFKFKEFANAILQDLIRIIARLLVVQALNAAFGPAGGAAGGLISGAIAGGKQDGGTVQPSRSFVVGENGPELFTPDRTGSITPNAKDQPAQAAPVNVQVVNVQSEDDIPNAINEGNADEAIINALARNKDRVNQVIA